MAMALTADGSLYARLRQMLPELIKFGVVGGLGAVIDLGGAAVLNSDHTSPITAKAISVTAATVFTYLGSRFWTFKHRENQASVTREAVLFISLNVVGLLIAEAVIGVVTYVMGLRGTLEYNAASVIGTGLGTVFRFYAYRTWVFTAPAGRTDFAPGAMSRVPDLPDYPPWQHDQGYAPAYAAPAPAYAGPQDGYAYAAQPQQYNAPPQEYGAQQYGAPYQQYEQYDQYQQAPRQYGAAAQQYDQAPHQYEAAAQQYEPASYQHEAAGWGNQAVQLNGQLNGQPNGQQHGQQHGQPNGRHASPLAAEASGLPRRPVPSGPRTGGGKHRRR
jgi:putative flippase GtrA